MSVESVISLKYLYNGHLQNVEGDISNSTESVNQQSEESRGNDIASNITNGSVSENETECNSASQLMEEPEKYVKLNKVMCILGINVLMLTLYYLFMVLALVFAYKEDFLYLSAICGYILVYNLFIVSVSRIWKHSKDENIIHIIITGLVSVIISGEILIYYYHCIRLHKLTLRHKSRSYYKQTLQHIDDLRCMVGIVTVLQVIPQSALQCFLVWTDEPQAKTVIIFQLLCLISAIVTFACCNYNEELGERHRVTIVTVLMTCISVCTYLLDVFSDLYLAGKYFYSQQWFYACPTVTFIIVPGFYITWLRYYRDGEKMHWNALNLVKIILNLDPVHGYWKSINLIAEVRHCQMHESLDSGYSEDRRKWYAELVKNNHTVAISRYNESYTESVMQLILQLAILLQEYSYADFYFDSTTEGPITFSITASLTSLAIGPVSMFRTKRIQDYIDNEELKENDPLRWTGTFIQFMGYFLAVVARVLAISFAISAFPIITTCLVIGNCIVVFLFMTFQPETSPLPLPYKIGQSIIYTFTPPTDDLTTEMLFHIVYLVENVLLTIFWVLTPTYFYLSHRFTLRSIEIIFAFNIIGIAIRYYYQKNYKKFMKIPVDQGFPTGSV